MNNDHKPNEWGALKKFEVSKDYLKKILEKKENNKVIVKHYRRYRKNHQSEKDKIGRKVEAIESCNNFWFIDFYQRNKVKDFKATNLCRDKFCSNCKVVKSASRRMKFYPLIEGERQKGHHVYHLVLTAPRVTGEQLPNQIKTMFEKFGKYLIRYMSIKLKIKGVTEQYFNHWGFEGAIRSLEVTYKTGQDTYHPHLHVMLVCRNQILGHKTIENKFSIDHRGKREKRLFSKEEVLIQKIWFLLMNGMRVNEKNINELEQGYSCMMDEFGEEHYNELFKYMTKTNEGSLSYRNFETLYDSLLGVRQIQGYGCFFGVQEDDELKEMVADMYESILDELRIREEPMPKSEKIEQLFADDENLLISRNRILSYLARNKDGDSL